MMNWRQRFKQYTLLSASVLAVIISFLEWSFPQSLKPQPAGEIASRLQELSRVREALREVDRYVMAQQHDLVAIDQDLRARRREKEALDKVVTLDRAKVQALLEYQAALQERAQWRNQIFAFLVGVFSSLTAALIVSLSRKRGGAASRDSVGEHGKTAARM